MVACLTSIFCVDNYLLTPVFHISLHLTPISEPYLNLLHRSKIQATTPDWGEAFALVFVLKN